MASANEWLLEESIRHALDLRQYENGIVRRLIAVLNRTDSRLFAELTEKLEHLGPDSFSVERLDALLASVRALNTEAFEAVQRELTQTLKEFTDSEVAYQRQMLVTALPVQVSVASVSAESVYAAALARPFQGVLLREVWKDLDAQRMKQVRQTIAQGFVEGRTTAQIIRDLRGTRAKGYADGLVNRSRRDVESVVRTAMGHYAGFVADRSMEANGDLVKAVMWVSTLDLRTTPACQARDGKQYTPGTHKPIGHSLPWGQGPGRYHWNCRSHQVPVTKSWRELGVDMDEFTPESRASMDGQVPAETTYQQWLAKQSAGRQDQVLGRTRGQLLRAGKLPLERMYDNKGAFISLEELRKRDAEAFKRAGL